MWESWMQEGAVAGVFGSSPLGGAGGGSADPRRVLVVDDDPTTRDVILRALERDGFEVVVTSTLTGARDQLEFADFDLVVVDLVLPDGDGLDLIEELRDTDVVAVIAVTGRSAEGDRVLGLETGADDYVVKPFSPRELSARVSAVLRRAAPPEPLSVLRHGDLVIDLRSLEVHRHGRRVPLTRKEFDLLVALATRPRRACSHQELLAWVWESSEFFQDPATVTEHIRRIRKKIGDDADDPGHIVTVRGKGYRWEP